MVRNVRIYALVARRCHYHKFKDTFSLFRERLEVGLFQPNLVCRLRRHSAPILTRNYFRLKSTTWRRRPSLISAKNYIRNGVIYQVDQYVIRREMIYECALGISLTFRGLPTGKSLKTILGVNRHFQATPAKN